MSWLDSFLVSLAAAAAWQVVLVFARHMHFALVLRAMCAIGSLFVLIGEWLQKKGGFNVKPLRTFVTFNQLIPMMLRA